MTAIAISTHAPEALAASQWDEIWNLTRRYVDTTRDYLESKLRHHTRIAMFRTPGELVGVAALDVCRTRFEGRDSVILFTSSVIIDEPYRGRALIQRLGVRSYLEARLKNPLSPIYWMFDTFSYKSYVLLARNFAEFWPRCDAPTPPRIAAFIDHLARERYGADWIPQHGIVRRSGQKKLRPHTAPIAETSLADPNVRFFVTANPGHADGDMLVCLCPLKLRNWRWGQVCGRRFFLPGVEKIHNR